MTIQPISQTQVQQASILGTAVLSATFCLKKTLQVLIGSDSLKTRTHHWDQASQQNTYFSSLQKRIQYFTGTDSLSARVSHFLQGSAAAINTVLMISLLNASEQKRQLETQLTEISAVASNSKALAGANIEACLAENRMDGILDVIRCLGELVPELLAAQTDAKDYLDMYINRSAEYHKTLSALKDTQLAHVVDQKASQAEQEKLTAQNQFYQQIVSSLQHSLEQTTSQLHHFEHLVDSCAAQIRSQTQQRQVDQGLYLIAQKTIAQLEESISQLNERLLGVTEKQIQLEKANQNSERLKQQLETQSNHIGENTYQNNHAAQSIHTQQMSQTQLLSKTEVPRISFTNEAEQKNKISISN